MQVTYHSSCCQHLLSQFSRYSHAKYGRLTPTHLPYQSQSGGSPHSNPVLQSGKPMPGTLRRCPLKKPPSSWHFQTQHSSPFKKNIRANPLGGNGTNYSINPFRVSLLWPVGVHLHLASSYLALRRPKSQQPQANAQALRAASQSGPNADKNTPCGAAACPRPIGTCKSATARTVSPARTPKPLLYVGMPSSSANSIEKYAPTSFCSAPFGIG